MRWCAGLRSPRPSSRGCWRSSCPRPMTAPRSRRWLLWPRGQWISGPRASIRSTAMDWWVRTCAGSRRSPGWGHIKSNPRKIPRAAEEFAAAGRSTRRRVADGPRPREETTMKIHHLFTSAAIAAVLAVAAPAHAQILGGGAHGGLGGTLGGGIGGMGGPMNDGVGGSVRGGARGSVQGGAGGELDGLGRAERTVGAGTQGGARAGARAAGETEASAGKTEASAGKTEASARHEARKGVDLAADTASAAAASAPQATAST